MHFIILVKDIYTCVLQSKYSALMYACSNGFLNTALVLLDHADIAVNAINAVRTTLVLVFLCM